MGILNPLTRYFFMIVTGVIFTISLSPTLQRAIAAKGWIPNQYRFGDLYNTSNLRMFKEVDFGRNAVLLPSDEPLRNYNDVDLYTIGDSFTPMDTSFYAGRRNHHIWLGVNVDTVKLDPSRKSILIIEVIERTIQERLKDDYQALYIGKGYQVKGQSVQASQKDEEVAASFWWDRFGDQINQRIEFLLFNSDPFLRLKEWKSDIMLSWFNRTHSGAVISKDHKHLFYDIEADPGTEFSPFYNIPSASIDSVVNNMNSIRDHYMETGFAEVYFCLVPNKVTVCETDRFKYNNQISKIEGHTLLEAPVLSIEDTLRAHPEWYHLGDGHWTVKGQRYWLKVVNNTVKDWSKEKYASK